MITAAFLLTAEAEEALRLQNEELSFLIDAAPGVLYTCKPEGDFAAAFISLSVKAQLGYDPSDFTSDPGFWANHIHPEDKEKVFAGLGALFERGSHTHEYRFLHADGSYHWMHDQLSLLRDSDGKPERIVGFWNDINERKEMEKTLRQQNEQLAHIAHHDALTGLPNRVLLRERIEDGLKRAKRGETFALLCLDLDQFKNVNDTLGHPAGDELLKSVAERLRGCVRETNLVARLGGDEFAIIQIAIEQKDDIAVLASRIRDAIRVPFDIEDHEVVIDTSIGIAIAPDDGINPDELLKKADMALYRAKADGPGTFCFFEPVLEESLKARHALGLELRKALSNGEMDVQYQPLVDLNETEVSGFEALLRWTHSELGTVSPDTFIPLAEQMGLINSVGEWVLCQACMDAASWPSDIKVAVNISPVQFKSQNLVQTVIGALAGSGLSPNRLELEITESALLQDDQMTLTKLHHLSDLGVRISMDDFGTGYSSLRYLRKFKFDKIKIDTSFVSGLCEGDENVGFVQAIIGLAYSLGVTTTAEGVETEGQLEIIRQEGCAEAQGYLFSRPMFAREILDFLLQDLELSKRMESAA